MSSNIESFINYFLDSFCIENRYVMVTYYVTPFASFFINYLPHHLLCLCGTYVTTYVTSTMASLRASPMHCFLARYHRSNKNLRYNLHNALLLRGCILF